MIPFVPSFQKSLSRGIIMESLTNDPNFTKPRGLIYILQTICLFKVIFSTYNKGFQAFPSQIPKWKQKINGKSLSLENEMNLPV